ncbi:MAG: hypothetical protein K6T83_14730 [Alicyclobacillus sp.]|nr:hypothetical protein [Alicyclobacillus sp.]
MRSIGRTWVRGSVAAVVVMSFDVMTSFTQANQNQRVSTRVARVSSPHASVQFHPSAWLNMGDLVFVSADNTTGDWDKLYTLTDTPTKERMYGPSRVQEHMLLDQVKVIYAKFSRDGRWLAAWVEDPIPQGQEYTETLWLLSADGSFRARLATGNHVIADWSPSSDELIYGYGSKMFTVTPRHQATPVPLRVPKDVSVDDIRFSPNAQFVALNVTFPQHIAKQSWLRHDEIGLWNRHTGNFQSPGVEQSAGWPCPWSVVGRQPIAVLLAGS